jgi:hypothetical protein
MVLGFKKLSETNEDTTIDMFIFPVREAMDQNPGASLDYILKSLAVKFHTEQIDFYSVILGGYAVCARAQRVQGEIKNIRPEGDPEPVIMVGLYDHTGGIETAAYKPLLDSEGSVYDFLKSSEVEGRASFENGMFHKLLSLPRDKPISEDVKQAVENMWESVSISPEELGE